VLSYDDEVSAAVADRRLPPTPANAAAIYPALCAAATVAGPYPLDLVELWPACGFELCADQFEYDYGTIGLRGRSGSECRILYRLSCAFGAALPPMPTALSISHRIGLALQTGRAGDESDALMNRCASAVLDDAKANAFDNATRVAARVHPELCRTGLREARAIVERWPTDHVLCVIRSFAVHRGDADTDEQFQIAIDTISRHRRSVQISLGEHRNKRGARLEIAWSHDGGWQRHVLGYCNASLDAGTELVWVAPTL
jgi:hypothetical protein